nr:unnamed protein product [Haemonchus contortus]
MRARRPRRSLSESERKAKKEAYTGELVKDADQRYRERKGRVEDTTPESALGRLSDLIPLEESIDPRYPAQRIIISNFVRRGCRIKRWLYEDTYPIHSHRPTIGELVFECCTFAGFRVNVYAGNNVCVVAAAREAPPTKKILRVKTVKTNEFEENCSASMFY